MSQVTKKQRNRAIDMLADYVMQHEPAMQGEEHKRVVDDLNEELRDRGVEPR